MVGGPAVELLGPWWTGPVAVGLPKRAAAPGSDAFMLAAATTGDGKFGDMLTGTERRIRIFRLIRILN